MPKKITLQDIARAVNVSVSSVSRALSGDTGVGSEIREKIRNAAQKLGVDIQRKNKATIVAFVLGNRDVLHPFHSRVLCGAEAYCSARGWDMTFLSFRYPTDLSWKQLPLPQILQRRDIVRAAILSGTNSENLLLALAQRGIPFSVLGNNVRGDWKPEHYDVVWSDDAGGGYEATSYLISLGHRNIWFIGNCSLPWYARACEGYHRAMADKALAPHVEGIDSENENEVGYLSAKALMARREPVTAIVAGTVPVAQSVCKALRDSGLAVPDQISVAGVGHDESVMFDPPLTTAREFPGLVGKRLAELVINRITRPDLAPQNVTVHTELVKRESCRPYSPPLEEATQQLVRAGTRSTQPE